ncbi:MAG: cytidine deaminase [Eubacteriales bacterium]|nr:cytidine deaminase [Eubacteriales bacterium]MDD3349284.1 cytidine deaminase [Eubacteriales bacterium]
MDEKALFLEAKKMLPLAYAPFSNFHVGAALLTKDGKLFTGVNVENSSYGATICAERTAFVKAVSEGYRDFSAIAIASSGGEALPCGICRQFMYEFNDDLKIICGEDENNLHIYRLNELLPGGFRLREK